MADGHGQAPVLVLGMHRSGTSMLSLMLGSMNCSHGHSVMPADESNPLGYGENAAVHVFNERVLMALNSSCLDLRLPAPEEIPPDKLAQLRHDFLHLVRAEFSAGGRFVIKDPRICRLLPFWRAQMRGIKWDPAYVLILRHPMEVAHSLQARDGTPVESALFLWLQHYLLAERHTRGCARIFTIDSRIFADPPAEAQRLGRFLGINMTQGNQLPVDPKLHHHSTHSYPDGISVSLQNWCETVWQLACNDSLFANPEILDHVFDEFKAFTEATSWKLSQTKVELERRCDWALSMDREFEKRTGWALRLDRDLTELSERVLRLDRDLTDRNHEINQLITSIQNWQRSWLRRAFSRWQPPQTRKLGFLRRLERSIRMRLKASNKM